MTLSRMTVIALLLAAAAPAVGQESVTAEEVLQSYNSQFKAVGRCKGGEDADAIVVCGRRGPDPYRLPLPVEPEKGARVDGEAADTKSLLALEAEPCNTVRQRPKADRLDLLAIAATAASMAATLMKVREPEPEPVKKCG